MKKTTLLILAISLGLMSCKAEPAASPLTSASASASPTLVATPTPANDTTATPAPASTATPVATATPATTATAVPATPAGCSSAQVEGLKCIVAANPSSSGTYQPFIDNPTNPACTAIATAAFGAFPNCKPKE